MTTFSTTPLHAFHIENGARMVDFAGWHMPIQYTSIIEEHLCVRNHAGLFDVSHMGEITIKGPDSTPFLDHLLTHRITKLSPGQCHYTILCRSDGGAVDDLLAYCFSSSYYLLCVNASNIEKDFQWILDNKGTFDVQVENVSSSYGQIALQGPKALEILRTFLSDFNLKRNEFIETTIGGVDLLISVTGYTGEEGVEIYIPASKTLDVVKLFLETGKSYGLRLIGLGARDSLRLEAGYSLYGHEISETISPIHAGLNFAVTLKDGREFIGSQALREQKFSELKQKVIFFKLADRRIARPGAEILTDSGDLAGEVLSGTHSPVLEKPIGSALIYAPYFNEPLFVQIRKDTVALTIQKPPFFKK
jgi:aminomethyltransferase